MMGSDKQHLFEMMIDSLYAAAMASDSCAAAMAPAQRGKEGFSHEAIRRAVGQGAPARSRRRAAPA